jgi:hypothetical protein
MQYWWITAKSIHVIFGTGYAKFILSSYLYWIAPEMGLFYFDVVTTKWIAENAVVQDGTSFKI